jgi:hypothetical protein
MKSFCLVSLLLVAGCSHVETAGSGKASAAARLEEYYPLAVGNCWTYATSFQGQTQPDLKVCIVKEADGFFIDDQKVPSRLRFDAAGLRDGKVRYLLKVPLEEGNKWMSVADVRTVEHYQIEAVGKKIEVPAGVFSDCVMVRMEVRITEEQSMINRITFAPGVGILEIYVSLKKGAEQLPQSVMRLKKYQPASTPS